MNFKMYRVQWQEKIVTATQNRIVTRTKTLSARSPAEAKQRVQKENPKATHITVSRI